MGIFGPQCESCAMPLKGPDAYGTEEGGRPSKDFCKDCYQDGMFREPGLTLTEMKQRSQGKLIEMGVPTRFATVMAKDIHKLKRWRG
jgi:hypothetical protein